MIIIIIIIIIINHNLYSTVRTRSEIWNARREIWDVKYEIRDVSSENQDLRSEIWDVRSDLWGARSVMSDPRWETWVAREMLLWDLRCDIWDLQICLWDLRSDLNLRCDSEIWYFRSPMSHLIYTSKWPAIYHYYDRLMAHDQLCVTRNGRSSKHFSSRSILTFHRNYMQR